MPNRAVAERRCATARAIRVAAAVPCSGTYCAMADFARWETDFGGARLAYEEAGLGPQDVDVVECHDVFSVGEILTL